MSLTAFEERIIEIAGAHGYRMSHVVKYYCEVEHPECEVVVYVDRRRALRNAITVMVDPRTDLAWAASLPGLTVASRLRHGSNMRRFPKRPHTGRTPSPYAHRVDCEDFGALGRLLAGLAGGN